jgi:hypothetical protein
VKHRYIVAVAAGALLSGAVCAHHSFTATYDEGKTVEIKAELVQFMFRNPHAWVHIRLTTARRAHSGWA